MSNFKVVTPETPKAVEKALTYVKQAGLTGDYYEFGVYTGFCLLKAYDAVLELGFDDTRLIGLDSFEGLPALEGIDQGWKFKKGDYASSFARTWTNLDSEGVDWTKISLLKLWFDRLPQLRLPYDSVLVALIDCDLYHSTVPVLQFLESRLQDHCILVFDDWGCFDDDPDKGQRRAFREFVEENPLWVPLQFDTFSWHGKSFIMRRLDLYEAEHDDLSYYTSWS